MKLPGIMFASISGGGVFPPSFRKSFLRTPRNLPDACSHRGALRSYSGSLTDMRKVPELLRAVCLETEADHSSRNRPTNPRSQIRQESPRRALRRARLSEHVFSELSYAVCVQTARKIFLKKDLTENLTSREIN